MGFDIFSSFIPFFAGVGVGKRKGIAYFFTLPELVSICDHLNSSGITPMKDLILRNVDKESGVLKEEGVQSP